VDTTPPQAWYRTQRQPPAAAGETIAIAEEVRGTGVRILALCPGAVTTEIDVFAHNEGLLGKLPSLTAEQVAKTRLRALDEGRGVKVVGGLNKFLPLMGRLMPRWAIRWLMEASTKPPRTRSADKGGA
jgi:short-subunit dehydrogenase